MHWYLGIVQQVVAYIPWRTINKEMTKEKMMKEDPYISAKEITDRLNVTAETVRIA